MSASPLLNPNNDKGWTSGFANMLAKENKNWWNARSLAIQFLLWLLIVNGMVALAVFALPSLVQGAPSGSMLDMTPTQIANIGVSLFFQLSGIAMLMGAIIIGHDSISRERESGTAAWLLSKPLSRRSFVLSKLVANVFGMLVIMVLAQGVIAYILCSVALHGLLNIPAFLTGLGLLGLDLTFFMVLSICLGAFTTSKGVTLGVPILTAIAGSIIMPLEPLLPFNPHLEYYLPWNLAGTAVSVITGSTMDITAIYPVIATVILIILFTLAAVLRFDSLEL
jgi:ABC-2 type transport system permease protein